jgi:hypothetical protein
MLFAEVGKLIFTLIGEYYSEAAGRPLVTGMVSSHQTFGEFATFHPHWHTIILEGGFDSFDFIAQVTLHIPPKGKQLVRRYGTYSSRRRATWKDRPVLRNCAPERWYGRAAPPVPAPDSGPKQVSESEPLDEPIEVCAAARKKAWARLLAKVYEVNPFLCPNCGATMSVIAVIQDPVEIRRIVQCLAGRQSKIGEGRGPPG